MSVNEAQINVMNESIDKIQSTIDKYMKELENAKEEKNKLLKNIENDKSKFEYELNELESILLFILLK